MQDIRTACDETPELLSAKILPVEYFVKYNHRTLLKNVSENASSDLYDSNLHQYAQQTIELFPKVCSVTAWIYYGDSPHNPIKKQIMQHSSRMCRLNHTFIAKGGGTS